MADKKDNLVVVCRERCRVEGSEELLKRWLPAIGKYANIFNIKIVVDVSDGEQVNVTIQDDEPVIYLHLNSYPSSSFKKRIVKNPSLFGFAINGDLELRDIEIKHYGFGGFGFGMPPGKQIKSPENLIVGFVGSGNLYIYPGILGNPHWPDNQDLHILSGILYWTFPEILIPKYNKDKIDPIAYAGYKLIKTNMKSGLRSKRGLRLRKVVETFLWQGINLDSKNLYKEQEEIQREMSSQKSEYFKKLEKINDLEEKLELALKKNKTRDFGEEFEKIMRMDTVLSVKVNNEMNKPHLIVRTGAISQTPAENESYDIGEFDIVIYAEPKRDSIHFYQNRKLGHFKHYHALPNNTCFGTSTVEGLNGDVERLISQFDIVPLVHLLLTFLVKESNPPSERPTPLGDPIQPWPEFVYTPEERENDKKEFIEFMHVVTLGLSTTGLASLLTKEIETKEKISDQRRKLRVELEGIEDTMRLVESRVAVDSNHFRQESNRLIGDDDVFWIAGDQNQIQVYFNSPVERGISGYKGYILRIGRNEGLEIFYSSGFSATDFFKLSHLSHAKLSSQMEKELYRLKFQGKIGELVLRVKNLVAGGLLDWVGV